MITVFAMNGSHLAAYPHQPEDPLPDDAVWVDLLEPSEGERAAISKALGVSLPTREDMDEIQVSSRLYEENGTLFMTALVVAVPESETPRVAPVGFILAGRRLATVRFSEPRFITIVAGRLEKSPACHDGSDVLLMLLDGAVDRYADVLEIVSGRVDQSSHDIFNDNAQSARAKARAQGLIVRYRETLRAIGRTGELVGTMRDSLTSLRRLAGYADFMLKTDMPGDKHQHLKAIMRDFDSLGQQAEFLSGRISFLLDATLGLVSIQQNDIVRIFTIVATVLMPPTLVAGIYGMNFKNIPEYDWSFGYAWGLGLILASALVPVLYFRWRGWL